MRGALELPGADREGLQASQIRKDQRCLAENECKWERYTVEEWQQLNAEILLAGRLRAACLKAVHSIWLFTIDHEDLSLSPDASDELLFVELNDAPSVQILQVALLEQEEGVR